jgi:uncharacterized protein (TIGR03084 family)
VDQICDDLAAEHRELDELVAVADLSTPTPARGWSVGDQISHLWFFDQQALIALTDPPRFEAGAAELLAAVTDGSADPSVALGRVLGKGELIRRWRVDRATLLDVARSVDARSRVPWYGPSMGARSFVTARLMETWAHGQDVADALGVVRPPTDRLRHVAHIGIAARPFSFAINGLPPPDEDVFVSLAAPSGDAWCWGREGAASTVRGPALDFCLVVTQRRHLDDVDLEVTGDVATRWMAVAQAFAGPPGPGRPPTRR